MPMRSLTTDRIRCLQPRYRSVVCTENVPQKELDVLQLSSRSMAEPGTGPSFAAAVSQSFNSILTQSSTQTPLRLHLPIKKNRPEHKQSDAAQDASGGTSRALVPIMKTRLRVEQWRFLPNRVLVRMAD